MKHSQNFDELMVVSIGNTLRGKVSGENFDESITCHQNLSDFSPVKVLRYTVNFNFESMITPRYLAWLPFCNGKLYKM